MILLFFKFAVEVVRAATCLLAVPVHCVKTQRLPSTVSLGTHPEVGQERSRIKNKCKCILTR